MTNPYYGVNLEMYCPQCEKKQTYISKQSKHGVDFHQCLVCKSQIRDDDVEMKARYRRYLNLEDYGSINDDARIQAEAEAHADEHHE